LAYRYWYEVNRLGPIGMLMSVAADMEDISHDASEGDLFMARAHLQPGQHFVKPTHRLNGARGRGPLIDRHGHAAPAPCNKFKSECEVHHIRLD
jgi:hypothetical protein